MLLRKEQPESYENVKICCICKETFKNKYLKDRKYCKFRDHCHYTGEYRGDGHNICNLKSSVAKKIPIVFQLSFYHKRTSRRIKKNDLLV